MRAPLAFALAVVALVGACKAPFGGDEPLASPEPRLELSEPAAPLDAEQQPPPPPAAAPEPVAPSSTSPAPTTAPPVATSDRVAAEPAARQLLALTDAPSDAGLQARDYADLLAVTLVDAGGRLRVAVDVGGDVPTTLAGGEVQGVGIDLYRTDDADSDYQVFLDGGSDGWRAYLQTPDGFVDYPGTFRIGGRRFVVEVPWPAVGGREDARVGVFCDWSAPALAVNQASSDRAPDKGTASFAA